MREHQNSETLTGTVRPHFTSLTNFSFEHFSYLFQIRLNTYFSPTEISQENLKLESQRNGHLSQLATATARYESTCQSLSC